MRFLPPDREDGDMARAYNMVLDHDFYCTQCAKKGIPICRTSMREPGHLKILYCLNCGREVNHAECVPGSKYDKELFLREWKSGNFDTDGMRKLPLSEWKRVNNDEPDIVPKKKDLTIEEWMEIFQG